MYKNGSCMKLAVHRKKKRKQQQKKSHSAVFGMLARACCI